MANNGRDHGEGHPHLERRVTQAESTIKVMTWISAVIGTAVIVALTALIFEAVVRGLS